MFLLAGLLSFMASGADGHAEPIRSRPDVVAALERIRDTGIFPEYLSLEYVELHRAVAEIVDRDPHGYVGDLAARVLTRVVVNLERPLIPSDEEPSLAAGHARLRSWLALNRDARRGDHVDERERYAGLERNARAADAGLRRVPQT
jgi:hypothetical protein